MLGGSERMLLSGWVARTDLFRAFHIRASYLPEPYCRPMLIRWTTRALLNAAALSVVLTLVLAGCSGMLGADEPNLSVSLGLQQPHSEPLTLRAEIGGRRVEVAAAGSVMSRELSVPRYGEVPVDVVLFTPGGDTLGAVRFTQRLRRGHNHWVDAHVGDRRPLGHCDQLAATPLRSTGTTAGADSLFVMYGSLAEGEVC